MINLSLIGLNQSIKGCIQDYILNIALSGNVKIVAMESKLRRIAIFIILKRYFRTNNIWVLI